MLIAFLIFSEFITVDFESLEDNSVTIRNRDTMKQERISIDKIIGILQKKII